MKKLHILTLSWQGKDKLQKLKPSLLPALEGLDWTWHIRDNGSSDGSVEEIRNWNHPNINLIAYPNNKNSYSSGMNELFKEASPTADDFILTLNNDIIINDPNSLKNMINILDKDKEVGIVGAKLNYTNTQKIQHCGVLFSKMNGLPFHYRAGVVETEYDRINRYYPIITGAVALLPANIFAECYTNPSGNKGFCEDYFFAFEDCDMCLRISNHLKKKVVYCGETNIFHEESASLKKNPVHKMFWMKNCQTFVNFWNKYVDISLIDKYKNDDYYAVYRGK